jgi:hypothetical protein
MLDTEPTVKEITDRQVCALCGKDGGKALPRTLAVFRKCHVTMVVITSPFAHPVCVDKVRRRMKGKGV